MLTNTKLNLFGGDNNPTIIGEIDLQGNESVKLNFRLNDIRDFTSVKSSYSRSITIPGDDNVNKIFKNIFSIGVDGIYDQNKIVRCSIDVDTLNIMKGSLQLTKISYNKENNIQYNVVIYDEFDSLIKSIGDKKLTDLPLSGYSHIYNKPAITETWRDSAYQLPYYYPLIDRGQNYTYQTITNNSLQVKDFLPCCYLTKLFSEIFADAGYTYTSQLFHTNEDVRNIIITNGKTELSNSSAFISDHNCFVGLSANTTESFASNVSSIAAPARFDNENGIDGFYDSGDNFDTSFPNWTYGSLDPINIEVKFRATGSVTVASLGGGGIGHSFYPLIDYSLIDKATGIVYYQGNLMPPTTAFPSYASFSAPIAFDTGPQSVTLLLQPGTNLRVSINVQLLAYVPFNDYVASIDFYKANTYFLVNCQSGVVPGSTITGDMFVPDIKQSDFLKSVNSLFNLWYIQDKNNSKYYRVETKDDYYNSSSVVKDWTLKLDSGKNLESVLIPEIQANELLFTYKEDKDFFNKDYQNVYDQIYGQKSVLSGNEWTKDRKVIDNLFSPTPSVDLRSAQHIIIPKFFSEWNAIDQGKKTTVNPRILYRHPNGSVDLSGYSLHIVFSSETFSSYPYAGHLYPEPFHPTHDLNYGVTRRFFHTGTPIDYNLYKRFWSNTVAELFSKDSRLITGWFHLTPEDIADFEFNDKIYIEYEGIGNYYYVNQIIDYNPAVNGLTKVELRNIILHPSVPSAPLSDFVRKTSNNVSSNIVIGSGNNGGNGGNVIIGNNNSNDPGNNTTIIFGNNNTVGYGNNTTIINSNGNTIYGISGNTIIGGFNNYINYQVQNTTVIGLVGYTATTSNTLYTAYINALSGITTTNLNVSTINGLPLSALCCTSSGGTGSGSSGSSGSAGTSGSNGSSGTSGSNGSSGTSGSNGSSGTSGSSGSSGTRGSSGTSGSSGSSGSTGSSGTSGSSGIGMDGSNSGRWAFNATVASFQDPLTTKFATNTTTISAMTKISIHVNNINTIDFRNWLTEISSFVALTNTVYLEIYHVGDFSVLGIFKISDIFNNGNYFDILLGTILASNGILVDRDIYTISFVVNGINGSSGLSGSNGSSGTSGSSGSSGSSGTRGSSGTSGSNGSSGTSGSNGSSGTSGSNGSSGTSGNGSSGTSGSSGSSGSTGSSGSSGTSGSNGSSGTSGSSGSAGTSGSSGFGGYDTQAYRVSGTTSSLGERWYANNTIGGTPTTLIPTINQLYLIPLIIPRTININQIAVNVTLAQTNGRTLIGIYNADQLSLNPTTLLFGSQILNAVTTGISASTVNQSLQGGNIYYLASLFTGTTAPTVTALSSQNMIPVFGYTSALAGAVAGTNIIITGLNGLFSSLPTDLTLSSKTISITTCPTVFFRIT
jgi:hypothetical protein